MEPASSPLLEAPELPLFDIMVMATISLVIIGLVIWRTQRMKKAMRDLTKERLEQEINTPHPDWYLQHLTQEDNTHQDDKKD